MSKPNKLRNEFLPITTICEWLDISRTWFYSTLKPRLTDEDFRAAPARRWPSLFLRPPRISQTEGGMSIAGFRRLFSRRP